jgi:hypothetical protein
MHSANIEWSAAGTEVVALRFTGRAGMPNDRQERFTSLAVRARGKRRPSLQFF